MVLGDISDQVANSIANGIDLVIVRLVDGFVDGAVTDSYGASDSYENSSIALDAIFSVATYTPNPYEMAFLDPFRDSMVGMFFSLWSMLITIAVLSALIMISMGTGSVASFGSMTGINGGYAVKTVLYGCVAGFFIFMLEKVFIWVVLLICCEMSEMVMMGSLNAITFTPDNLTLYTIMGVAYGLLSLCFEFRILVIMFFSCTCYLIGALLLLPATQEWAWKAHLYFIQITFFQFAVLVWYCFCIECIQGLPGTEGTRTSMYILMVLTSMYLAYKFMFKLDFIRMAGRATTIILVKKG